MGIRTNDLFDLSKSITAPLLSTCEFPWEALPKIREFILSVGPTLPEDEYKNIGDNVWVAKNLIIHHNIRGH